MTNKSKPYPPLIEVLMAWIAAAFGSVFAHVGAERFRETPDPGFWDWFMRINTGFLGVLIVWSTGVWLYRQGWKRAHHD